MSETDFRTFNNGNFLLRRFVTNCNNQKITGSGVFLLQSSDTSDEISNSVGNEADVSLILCGVSASFYKGEGPAPPMATEIQSCLTSEWEGIICLDRSRLDKPRNANTQREGTGHTQIVPMSLLGRSKIGDSPELIGVPFRDRPGSKPSKIDQPTDRLFLIPE